MHNLNAKALLLQYNSFYLLLGFCVGRARLLLVGHYR